MGKTEASQSRRIPGLLGVSPLTRKFRFDSPVEITFRRMGSIVGASSGATSRGVLPNISGTLLPRMLAISSLARRICKRESRMTRPAGAAVKKGLRSSKAAQRLGIPAPRVTGRNLRDFIHELRRPELLRGIGRE